MSVGLGLNIGIGIGIGAPGRVQSATEGVTVSPSVSRLITPAAKSNIVTATPAASRSLSQIRSVAVTASPSDTFLPSQLSNLVLDLDADVGITGSAGTFTWADQSGGGNNASAGAGSLGLSTNTADSDFNAHNSVSLNGTSDSIFANAIANTFSGTSHALYAVIVAKFTLTAAAGDVFCLSSSSSGTPFFIYRLLQSGGNGQQQSLRRDDSAANNKTVTGVNTTSGTVHLDEWRYDGSGNVNWTRDGTTSPAATAEVTTACTFSLFIIGAQKLGAGAIGTFQTMKVARVLVYSAVPTTGQQARLRSYLKTRYATP